MAQYLIKYIDTEGKHQIATSSDVFTLGGLKFNNDSQVFDETTIALKSELLNVSGVLIGDYIDPLDLRLDALETFAQNIVQPLEERFEATAAQTDFSVSGFSWLTSNAVFDVEVFKNGVRMFQSQTGNISGGDFEKDGPDTVHFFYGLVDGDRVVIAQKFGTA